MDHSAANTGLSIQKVMESGFEAIAQKRKVECLMEYTTTEKHRPILAYLLQEENDDFVERKNANALGHRIQANVVERRRH